MCWVGRLDEKVMSAAVEIGRSGDVVLSCSVAESRVGCERVEDVGVL